MGPIVTVSFLSCWRPGCSVCKRMCHTSKAATQLRGQFVSEVQGPGQGCLLALDFSLSHFRGRQGRERARFKIIRRTYYCCPWRVVQRPILSGC